MRRVAAAPGTQEDHAAVNGQEKEPRDWASYYQKTGFRPPRPTLLRALDAFDREPAPEAPRFAVDLGCGNGRDVVEMLRRGWRVLAIDAQESAIEGLLARPDLPPEPMLETRMARFEETAWPEADLVNSSFALPFCPQHRFPELWQHIVDSLRRGGRFSGHLFGDRDSWVGREGITFLDRPALDALLTGLTVEHLEEEDDDGATPRGTPKHWHIWHLNVRKTG